MPAFHVRLILTIAIALGTQAISFADPIISYQVQGGQPNTETFMGTAVRPSDLFDHATGGIVFNAFPNSPLEDVDAAHQLSNGNFVLSTSTGATLPGVGFFLAGELVEYNPNTNTATKILSIDKFGPNANATQIDAVYVFDNGDILLSTSLTATLGGVTFSGADLVRYDPLTDTATLFFDGDAVFAGTAGQKDIDAVHLEGQTLYISSLVNGGTLGNGSDLLAYSLVDGQLSLVIDGDGLFSGNTRNLNAVTFASSGADQVPEPASWASWLAIAGFSTFFLKRSVRRTSFV